METTDAGNVRCACLLAVVSLLAFAACALALPSSSAAVNCDPGYHCYGIVDWWPSGTYSGIQAGLTTSDLWQGSGSSPSIANNEIWNCDTSNCLSWVEDGWHIGDRVGWSGTGLAWFWADQPAQGPGCGGYSEYYGYGAVALGESHTAKIVNNNGYNGNGWQSYIYKDGTAIGHTAYCHADLVALGQAGTEIDHNDARTLGSVDSLSKKGASSGTWSSAWCGSYLVSDNPPIGIGWYQTCVGASFWK
jgi:hypothetical protein